MKKSILEMLREMPQVPVLDIAHIEQAQPETLPERCIWFRDLPEDFFGIIKSAYHPRLFSIGEVNQSGGVCDDCKEFRNDDAILIVLDLTEKYLQLKKGVA